MTEATISEAPEASLLRWNAPRTTPGGGEVRVHTFASKAEAGLYVAGVIAGALQGAVADRGEALWIGCGGTTPKPIYENLNRLDLDWKKITLAQVDERFVPVDDASSNTRMMNEALDPILMEGLTFLSLIEDIDDQDACAEKAEARLRGLADGTAPVFDIALMGMGPDAHYASIFPHHPINATVYDTERLVLPVARSGNEHEPALPRITLTVPALNNSRRILFFITGETKLEVLRTASQSTDPFLSPIGAFLAQCPSPVDFVWAP